MTNQPKRKKKRSLVRTLLYRFFTGLEILIKFSFFIPILLFMVWFSHKVDISGLFQGELAPREVANMLLAGDTVSNYDKMDERAVLKLYVQNLPEEQVPDTVALGSSRVLQLRQELVGGSFFNMGLSGASAMDIMNCFYLLDKEGKLPKNLIIEVDPWLFNGDSAADLNKKADTELFSEFLQKGLGMTSDYEEPDKLELWKALIDPAYFQGNVKYALKQRATGETTTEDGESIPFQAVIGDRQQREGTGRQRTVSVGFPQLGLRPGDGRGAGPGGHAGGPARLLQDGPLLDRSVRAFCDLCAEQGRERGLPAYPLPSLHHQARLQ